MFGSAIATMIARITVAGSRQLHPNERVEGAGGSGALASPSMHNSMQAEA
jgi:hypothetical protein